MTTSKAKKAKPAKRHAVALRLAETEYEALSFLAEKDRRSRSQYVEVLLIRHIADLRTGTKKGGHSRD